MAASHPTSKFFSSTHAAWAKKFRPLQTEEKTRLYPVSSLEGLRNKHPPRNLWTALFLDGRYFLVEGVHFVNRHGYVVSKRPWEDGYTYEVRARLDSFHEVVS